MRKKGIAGQRFGRLTVKSFSHTNSRRNAVWECECDCGNIAHVASGHLNSGHTKSCGCLRNDARIERCKTHGLYHTRLHRTWTSMKSRCNNPHNNRFYRYGARGISVCEAWSSNFKRFYDWAMSNGYADTLTIDRINPGGNYEPANCQWITSCENNSKRFSDKAKSISERKVDL